jgi:hypothetical protein
MRSKDGTGSGRRGSDGRRTAAAEGKRGAGRESCASSAAIHRVSPLSCTAVSIAAVLPLSLSVSLSALLLFAAGVPRGLLLLLLAGNGKGEARALTWRSTSRS